MRQYFAPLGLTSRKRPRPSKSLYFFSLGLAFWHLMLFSFNLGVSLYTPNCTPKYYGSKQELAIRNGRCVALNPFVLLGF